ncbi:PSD1 and planctomycete cytochrome C domain-containing protein [Urbifossiella limnaea]|uniref:Planctomycete cytochrome C n=1 Tax=Urbifossiella limnaea TaxID=2528023 RepID=A0A517XQL9_9BACT|nr:PSD1 and planctomycete cytochrome C domain-containing protein [Urbifossiella limnaea]QDU19800.1 Planctomycete cytochrome C [Urbifossiella limnaea]
MRTPLALATVFLFFTPPTTRADGPEEDQAAFFESKVRPVLSDRCYSCHSQAAKKAKGGLTLDSRESILKGGDSGPALVPGKTATSLLLKAVRYDGLEMPPTGKLPADEIAILTRWVEAGAYWPATAARPVVPPEVGVLTPERLRHWAWQPVKATDPPAPAGAGAGHPIDRFVLTTLAAKGLKPAPPADRRTLVRRATLDLLGLPPTPEEVEAFVADDSPDAYPRLIDRLLTSPHYGERWGRHWLDVARFSDGHGSFLDPAPLPEAWRYRDWVVKALNDDLPYDAFVKQQIAGDLLRDAPEAAAATGFLAVGPTYQSDGGDPESVAKARAETLDDRVDTVTRGFLALTVSCARCHDHMFDPVPQAEYYALAAVFNNTRSADRVLAPRAEQKRAADHKKSLDAATAALKTAKDSDPARRKELEADVARLKAATPPALPRVHAVEDAGAADMHLAIRGDPRKPGPLVPRRFLTALAGPNPAAWTTGSGRQQLAEAIASPTNPLTARVMVNRVWQHHFGRPLVATPSNFGLLGEKPSHPELLDWLAARFVADGWSLKKLHRLVMLSDAYRRSSQFDAAGFRVDGDNRYLWRMSPRRLEVEAWRDSLLAVTGELDRTVGGPAVHDILSSPRRTLYAAVSRNGDKLPADEFLRLFDFPSARATVSERSSSTVPQQALFLLNSPFMAARGKALAARLTGEARTTDARIDRAYALLYGRPVTDDERAAAKAFLAAGNEAEAWPRYAQALLGSYEFMQSR